MAMEHEEYDNNSRNHETNAKNTKHVIRDFIVAHPVITLLLVLLVLPSIGYYACGVIMIIASIAFLIFGFYLCIALLLHLPADDGNDSVFKYYGSKGRAWSSGMHTRCKDKYREQHKENKADEKLTHTLPDGLHELVMQGDTDAISIASEYDNMMRIVDASYLDSDVIQASYSEKMKKLGSLIADYHHMSMDKYSKDSLSDIETDYRNALKSIISQFHKTIQQANREKVRDMKSYISSIDDEDMNNNSIFDNKQ